MGEHAPRFSFGSMISDRPAMGEVFRVAALAAEKREPLCLVGDSGVGLHTLARNIVGASALKLYCAAIPESHQREAFDAVWSRAADEPLVLTEPLDLTEPRQREILRALRSPTAGARWVFCCYRPITNEGDVPELNEALRRIAVELPPLRERGDDAVLLARHFLRVIHVRFGLNFDDLSPRAVEFIRAYTWPGNVRELRWRMQTWCFIQDMEGLAGTLLEPWDEPSTPTPAS